MTSHVTFGLVSSCGGVLEPQFRGVILETEDSEP